MLIFNLIPTYYLPFHCILLGIFRVRPHNRYTECTAQLITVLKNVICVLKIAAPPPLRLQKNK